MFFCLIINTDAYYCCFKQKKYYFRIANLKKSPRDYQIQLSLLKEFLSFVQTNIKRSSSFCNHVLEEEVLQGLWRPSEYTSLDLYYKDEVINFFYTSKIFVLNEFVFYKVLHFFLISRQFLPLSFFFLFSVTIEYCFVS